jgi:hypothetical protein
MEQVTPKQHRIQVALDYLYSLPPAGTSLKAYELFTRAINLVEDEFLGQESWSIPRTFLTGARTERIYMGQVESLHPVPRYSGVDILIHVREVVFFSRYGAIEIQQKVADDRYGFKKHFEERTDLVIFQKPDSAGDGVWHTKNR